ncbi:hypothetical protein PT2222_40308 [Paraburkholderia tropica]
MRLCAGFEVRRAGADAAMASRCNIHEPATSRQYASRSVGCAREGVDRPARADRRGHDADTVEARIGAARVATVDGVAGRMPARDSEKL